AAPPGSGQANVVFCEEHIPPSNGYTILSPSQVLHLGQINRGAVVTPPPGTNTLIAVASSSATFANPLTVTGVTSNQQYPVVIVGVSGHVYIITIDQGADTSYTVSWGAGAGSVSIDASFVPLGIAVLNTILSVNLTSGGAISGFDTGGGGQQYVQVQNRPTFKLLTTRVSLAVAGAVLIAAPGVGSSIV